MGLEPHPQQIPHRSQKITHPIQGAVAESNGRLSAPFLRLGSIFCEESQFYNGIILWVEDMMDTQAAQYPMPGAVLGQ